MERLEVDLIVIGAGPGGYVAAIRAAQNGRKVALIEKDALGGVCLNVGCIPTKTLLAGAEVVSKIRSAADFGIDIPSFSIQYGRMKMRKDEVVLKMKRGLEGLIRANQITLLQGRAEFLSPHEVKVVGSNNVVVKGEAVIVATGSQPMDIPAFPCDHQVIRNSTSILELEELPKKLAIIGGGYIGCEFASLFAALGVEVVVIEALDGLIALQGKSLSQALMGEFKKQKIEMKLGLLVQKIDRTETGAVLHLSNGDQIQADMVLVSVGRSISTKGLGLEAAGVVTDNRGAVVVNDRMETSVPGIYAIGDVTGRVLLAHVASHQGIVAAVNATGGQAVMRYDAVPAVIFTHPEIATVGMTLEEAVAAGYNASLGKFPFQALGKAVAAKESDGFAQVVIDTKSQKILGAQAMGASASSLIAEMALAITNELTVESLAETIHAHPTLSESWVEAALLGIGTPIHYPPQARR